MAGKIYVGPTKLPNEYQEVEYLETDGNAYIQTTHQPGVRTKTVAVFSNVTGGTTPCPLFGAMDTDTEETSQYWAQWTGEAEWMGERFLPAVGGSASGFSVSIDPEGELFTFEIGDYTVSGSCETVTSKVSYGQVSESVSLDVWDNSFVKTTVYGAIFTVKNTVGVWDTIQNGLRLHSYKTYNYSSGSYVLARDYIPCYRKADNKPGLFDTVHQVFYTNASDVTESEFICGPAVSVPQTIAQLVSKIYAGVNGTAREVKRVYAGINGVARQIFPETYLPFGFQQVEYIEGTGAQWLKSGLILNNVNYRALLKMAVTNNSYSEDAYMFGCTGVRFNVFVKNTSDAHARKLRMGIGNGIWTGPVMDTAIHTYIINMNTKSLSYDGVDKSPTSNKYSQGTNNYPLDIFAAGISTDTTKCSTRVKGKLYDLKIWNWSTRTLLRSFYPCYRINDNKPGLYDIVNNVFYTNQGSEEFLIGPKHEEQL